jgi:hypothetical protein
MMSNDSEAPPNEVAFSRRRASERSERRRPALKRLLNKPGRRVRLLLLGFSCRWRGVAARGEGDALVGEVAFDGQRRQVAGDDAGELMRSEWAFRRACTRSHRARSKRMDGAFGKDGHDATAWPMS